MKNKISKFARRHDCLYAFDSQGKGSIFSFLGENFLPEKPEGRNPEKSWAENTGLFENHNGTFEDGILKISEPSSYLKTPVTFSAKE